MSISKTAIDKLNFKKDIKFTNSAREGWQLILETLNPSDRVLLPSYIGVTEREGSGIYDPVVNTNIKHDFYLLNSDLTISVSSIQSHLERNNYDLILLVHYFGFKIQNIEEIVTLCKKHGLIVVEDCAHLYNYNNFIYSNAGTHGDFAFYSLHKFFPFTEGGLYVQNNLALKKPDNSKIKLNKNYSNLLIKYQAHGIISKRIENFNLLDQLIQNIDGITPLKTLNSEDIPHNYPVLVENGLREKLYFWLIERDVTLIALYYRLIEPLSTENYRSMQDISNSILNLPVHQDVNADDIHLLINKIKEFYEKG